MKEVVIYYLVDPRTSEVRYVGKTEQPLHVRVAAHMRDKRPCHRVNWLRELQAEGLRPDAYVLESIIGDWPWQESERYWIAKLREMGARLTNNTSGGDGVPNLPKETRERMRQIWIGRKHTPETIEKLKTARRKRETSQATREKMSRSQKGRKITWGKAIAEGTRKLSVEDVRLIRAQLAAGKLVKDLASEFRVHRTTLSKIKSGTYFVK